MGEEGQTLRAVTIITDDVLPGIAQTRNVIDSPGEFKTKWTYHEAGDFKEKIPTLLLSQAGCRCLFQSSGIRSTTRSHSLIAGFTW